MQRRIVQRTGHPTMQAWATARVAPTLMSSAARTARALLLRWRERRPGYCLTRRFAAPRSDLRQLGRNFLTTFTHQLQHGAAEALQAFGRSRPRFRAGGLQRLQSHPVPHHDPANPGNTGNNVQLLWRSSGVLFLGRFELSRGSIVSASGGCARFRHPFISD